MRVRSQSEMTMVSQPCLDAIPASWDFVRLKSIAAVTPSNVDKLSVDGQTRVRLCNYTDVYYNNDITNAVDFMGATASTDQIERFQLRKGDVLITKDSEDRNDIAVPAHVPDDLPGVLCGYHLALLRPTNGFLGSFLRYLLDSRYARSEFSTRANGLTRYGLGVYPIKNFLVPLPSQTEQQAIADFLDRETAKIDTLIAKQEELIKLLEEKRQAVISHAVTKGLDPNAKMKDSGVPWLGEVPEGWEVKKLKWVISFQRGHDLPTQLRKDGSVPLVSSAGIIDKVAKPVVLGPGIVTGRYGTIGEFYLIEEDYWPLKEVGPLFRTVC